MSKKNDLTLGDRSLLVVTRYPTPLIPLAFISMALFHIPLLLRKKLNFYKLMGSGKNGTFDIVPDLNQWAVMVFFDGNDLDSADFKALEKKLLGRFIHHWWNLLGIKKKTFLLEPFTGHGTWDGRSFLNKKTEATSTEGRIAVLTRATIRLNKLKHFWSQVDSVANDMEKNKGFIYSIGIGEIPFIKQATFSIWESLYDMKNFAYQKAEHKKVIRSTRDEGWYSEELFLRFRLIRTNVEGL